MLLYILIFRNFP